jgi:hypothetical protein
VAVEALARMQGELDVAAAVREIFARAAIARQTSLTQAFGEPPLTLYRERDFYIELLFWHTGTTGVHEHRFSGAFLVAEGSSLHCRYRFEGGETITPSFRLGEVSLTSVEVLERGMARPIPCGPALIHSVFHLDAPSVTVVVRTPRRRGIEAEYRYPHLAIDPAARDAVTIKRLQLLALMRRTGWGDYVPLVCDTIHRCDIVAGFHVMSKARLHLDDRDFRTVASAMLRKHPRRAEALLRVAAEDRLKWRIAQLRERVVSAELRFFLGILLNVPDRERVCDAIRQRFPRTDPAARIHSWKHRLKGMPVELLRGL